MKRPRYPHDLGDRYVSGVIVTLANRHRDERVTRFESGTVDDALLTVLARFPVAHWRIVCISTPQTIQHDLRSRKVPKRRPARINSDSKRSRIAMPEAVLLGRIGRLDYLDGAHTGGKHARTAD